jgi:hypothetical protein
MISHEVTNGKAQLQKTSQSRDVFSKKRKARAGSGSQEHRRAPVS